VEHLIHPKHWRAVIVSVVLAACGYLFFSLWAGWAEVVHAVRQVGWRGLLVLLALSGVNYALRFVRWQLYLNVLGHPQPWASSLLIYLGGFALTTTPGKAGEALRSLFLKSRGVPYTSSVAAFLSERLADLLAVVVLCLGGVWIYPALMPLVMVALVTLGVVFFLIAQGSWLVRSQAHLGAKSGWMAGLLLKIVRLLAGSQACHRPRVLVFAMLLSLPAWGAEALAFDLLLNMIGHPAPATFSFFVYGIGMLAGALSFLPGGLGGTEATMVGLLVLQGLTQPIAIAATVVIRLTTLWFAVVLGLSAMVRLLRKPVVGSSLSEEQL
jgi:uncharacterized protein (TIRG00374 family)